MNNYQLTPNTETVLFNTNNCSKVYYNGTKVWPFTKIIFNRDPITINVNETYELNLATTVVPDTLSQNVTFESLNPDIAKITYSYNKGCIVYHYPTDNAGECIIRATAVDGTTADYKITVWDVKINGNGQYIVNNNIGVNENVTLNAEVIPSTLEKNWTYTDTDSVYTINATITNDVFLFKSPDTTGHDLTVKLTVPGCNSLIRKFTTVGYFKTIQLIPKTLTLYATGNSDTITYQTYPDDDGWDSIIWESSDTSIATVSKINGQQRVLVTSVNPGTCVIKAKSDYNNAVFGTCNVTVEPALKPTAITLDTTGYTLDLTYDGLNRKTLSVTPTPAIATDYTVTYTSSDPTIAYTSGSTVVGVSVGSCVITATTDNGLTATCNITVIQSTTADNITGISLTGQSKASNPDFWHNDLGAYCVVMISPSSTTDNRTAITEWTCDSVFTMNTAYLATHVYAKSSSGTVTGKVYIKVTDSLNNKIFTQYLTITMVNGVCTKVV